MNTPPPRQRGSKAQAPLPELPSDGESGEPQSRQRNPGRPHPKSSVGRDAIVAAARECLRVRAPGAVTIKEVAAKAGVDAALVRYYFGNREGLLTAAVAEMMAERQNHSRELLSHDWTPERRLRERLSSVLGNQLTEPNFHRLVLEQLFLRNDEDAKRAVETTAARGLALEVDFLQRSQPELRSVDPRFLNLCLLGLCEFFASSRPLVEALFGGRPVDEKLTDDYLNFAVDLLLNGLRTR